MDDNQSGQQAAAQLAHRLGAQGIATRRVFLPPGHDPNSFFVEGGGDAQGFQSLLQAASS
jgi:DNA primase